MSSKNKKYFIVEVSGEPDVIGVNNGIYQAEFDEKCFPSANSYQIFDNYFHKFKWVDDTETLKNADIPIRYLTLLRKSKITDFMCFSTYIPQVPFLMSLEAKNIFEKFLIPPHRYFKTKLQKKVLFYKSFLNTPYYFFYCPLVRYESIIFEKCEISNGTVHYEGFKHHLTLTPHKIKDLDHYQILIRKLSAPTMTKICMKEEFCKFDFIDTQVSSTIVSEKLKNAIEKEKLTGLVFKDIDIFFDN